MWVIYTCYIQFHKEHCEIKIQQFCIYRAFISVKNDDGFWDFETNGEFSSRIHFPEAILQL